MTLATKMNTGSQNLAGNLDVLQSFLHAAAQTAQFAQSYVGKLLLVSLLTNVVLAGVIAAWMGGFSLTLLLLLPACFIPSLLCLFVNGRLTRVIEIPQQLTQLKTDFTELNDQLKLLGIKEDMEAFAREEKISLRKRLKILIKVGPSLLKLKDNATELAQLDFIFSVLAVANPLFGLIFFSLIFPVAIWSIAALLCAVIWLVI